MYQHSYFYHVSIIINIHIIISISNGVPEVVHAELLEARAREGAGVVDALEEGVDLDRGLYYYYYYNYS